MNSALFSGFKGRHAGVLLHPTCLPSQQGIGCLGGPARDFVDWLADAKIGWWQLCPLGPTGYGDSPYQCFSVFAGNPYLIDLGALVEARLLEAEDLGALRRLDATQVEFGFLWEHFPPLLAKAYQMALANPALLNSLGNLAAFREKNAAWLNDFALFWALKKHFGGMPWFEWPERAREHATAIRTAWPETVSNEAGAVIFQQFLFFSQWAALREHAARRGVKIMGDAPIFAAGDSADVWASRRFFQLDARGHPVCVAGVPPDYFSPRGQLWGNPLYDWEALRCDGYKWWLRRLGAAFECFDAVRIDHFRAFHSYWSVPATAPDATSGSWVAGAGVDFFKAVRRHLGDLALVAEDLGDLHEGVHALRRATGLPGMAVLQFAFDGNAANPHLPHNLRHDCVVYPGTHDNNTTPGWYAAAGERERDCFRHYMGSAGKAPHWDLMRAAMTSVAALAVVPFQDILGLDATARFNTPGTGAGNWRWRFTGETLAHAREFLLGNLRALVEVSGRASRSFTVASTPP
ncbi:MAG: 4-alpha-glucanotransferase [Puniceicoccales bacterium]|nr:4-alpha-glucanotransferase [Puniceicoccales bacterium]